ncbi:unnamed protein product [Peniophora sp. CBMAI 1063]|nr:unnamed protein product [Peniophora sp. CBMAI 1063]
MAPPNADPYAPLPPYKIECGPLSTEEIHQPGKAFQYQACLAIFLRMREAWILYCSTRNQMPGPAFDQTIHQHLMPPDASAGPVSGDITATTPNALTKARRAFLNVYLKSSAKPIAFYLVVPGYEGFELELPSDQSMLAGMFVKFELAYMLASFERRPGWPEVSALELW